MLIQINLDTSNAEDRKLALSLFGGGAFGTVGSAPAPASEAPAPASEAPAPAPAKPAKEEKPAKPAKEEKPAKPAKETKPKVEAKTEEPSGDKVTLASEEPTKPAEEPTKPAEEPTEPTGPTPEEIEAQLEAEAAAAEAVEKIKAGGPVTLDMLRDKVIEISQDPAKGAKKAVAALKEAAGVGRATEVPEDKRAECYAALLAL